MLAKSEKSFIICMIAKNFLMTFLNSSMWSILQDVHLDIVM